MVKVKYSKAHSKFPKQRISMNFKCKILAIIISAYCGTSQSADLLEVWNGVGEHDPDVATALSAKLAGIEKRNQAISLWLPSVQIIGTSGKINSSSEILGANFTAPAPLGTSNGVGFNTSIRDGSSNTWALQARQAIFSQERIAHTRQLNLGAEAANVEWKLTNNELMLRTVQRYFEIVFLNKKLDLLKNEYKAIKIESEKSQEKFNIGESPIIDKHEAYAKEQELTAQIISNVNDLQVAKYMLSEVSKISAINLDLKYPKRDLVVFNPSNLDSWIQKAIFSNPLIKLMQTKLDIAHQDVIGNSISASTSLDLVAQTSQQKMTGSGDFGSASNNSLQQMVGIQLTIPLFSGGYTSSKHEEAIQLEDKTKFELESTKLRVIQNVQSSWLALSSGLSRISALSSSLIATNSKLEATKLAQEVGDRTTLDLINATNAKTLAEMNLLQAKIDYLINQLNLYALVGELDTEKLIQINAQLEM